MAPYLAMLDMAVECETLRAAMAHGAHKVVIKTSTRKAFEKLDRLEWSVAHLMPFPAPESGATSDEILATATGGQRACVAHVPLFCAGRVDVLPAQRVGGGASRQGRSPRLQARLRGGRELDGPARRGPGAGRHRSAACGLAGRGETDPGAVRPASAAPEGGAHASSDGVRRSVARAVSIRWRTPTKRARDDDEVGARLRRGSRERFAHGSPLALRDARASADDLARSAVLGVDADVHDPRVQKLLLMVLPVAARAAAEDFYHPREVVRAWFGQWTPEESLERLKRFARGPKKEAVRAEARPGRNDPCPCRSGKKWKKCHGGPGQADAVLPGSVQSRRRSV